MTPLLTWPYQTGVKLSNDWNLSQQIVWLHLEFHMLLLLLLNWYIKYGIFSTKLNNSDGVQQKI